MVEFKILPYYSQYMENIWSNLCLKYRQQPADTDIQLFRYPGKHPFKQGGHDANLSDRGCIDEIGTKILFFQITY